MDVPLILLLALVIDLILGEPPAVIHPVVWMGKVIAFLTKPKNILSPGLQFLYGLVVVMVTIIVFAIPVFFLLRYLKGLNLVAYIVVAAAILKSSFSLKELRRAALTIKILLVENKLTEAAFELRALVGRDTSQLDKSQMVSAAVESIAESSCDSFFAPLFYFALLGVPGAIGYRVINTLDAMIGHHGEFEYFGKFSARLDTVVNFIPARLAALTIVLASLICRFKAGSAWRIMLRDRRKTKSPNAGWTMSATAGALGVQLEKVGYYQLGDTDIPLATDTIDNSLKLVITTCLIWSLVLILVEVIYHVAT